MTETWTIADFDHNSPQYRSEASGLTAKMRAEGCPIGWSEQHGGFWVVASYERVKQVSCDPETFSSDFDPEGELGAGGIFIPTRQKGRRTQHAESAESGGVGAAVDTSSPGRLIPIEVDPPNLAKLRRIVMPFLSPDGVKPLESKIHEYVTTCLDEHIESGSLDLIHDPAVPIPAMLTRYMFGVPMEGWKRWAGAFHVLFAEPEGTPAHDFALQELAEINEEIRTLIDKRRQHPTDDIVSAIVHGTIDGVPLSHGDAYEYVMTVLAGGVDSTTSLLGHTFAWLNDHHDDRQRLIDDPDLLPVACEEMLRWSTINAAAARTATRDVEIGGQLIRRGDRVLVEKASANRDAARFDRPDEFILDRFPNPHMAFGLGPHRCIGSNIVRLEFKVVIGEVLQQMPDFELVPGKSIPYRITGVMNGWATMPATFTPGSRSGKNPATESPGSHTGSGQTIRTDR
jgi:cytochrome P450